MALKRFQPSKKATSQKRIAAAVAWQFRAAIKSAIVRVALRRLIPPGVATRLIRLWGLTNA